MNWNEMVNEAHKVLEFELRHPQAERKMRLLVACTVVIVQAIDELQEAMPSEPFEIRNVGPRD